MTERKKPKIEAARVTVIDGRRKIQREKKKKEGSGTAQKEIKI